MGLFGSSGIRGIANKEITPELALQVGLATGSMGRSAVIGRDPRIAAPMIQHAVTAGLLSAGCTVTDVGLVSTPTLAHATRDYDLGVMITASHNPAPYCGIKLWNPDGMAFDTAQQEAVERRMKSPTRAIWSDIGHSDAIEGAIESHMEDILDSVGEADLRVVVDCGSGAGSTITPRLLREMGCEVIALNAQPDGHFTSRDPEPKESNLSMLLQAVRRLGADVGIAHDGDADRMMAVDDRGRYVTGDKMLAYFARREGGDVVVVPVDTSMAVDDYLNARVERTRVGDVYVAEMVKRLEADFGGEPSGSWIFPQLTLCPDGILAAARLVHNIHEEGRLSDALDDIPEYPTIREAIPCKDREEAMRRIEAELCAQGEVNRLDGLRLQLEDGWILVRPSGTEPKIRLTAEAREPKRAEELYDMAYNIIRRSIGGL